MSFFPTSVPTSLELLDARNNKSITLSAAINDTVTTIPVTDTSDIPSSGYLTSTDGSNEVIEYTGKTLTTLTGCTRGADGTTASSHANGSTLAMYGNAKYHNILKDEIVAIAQNISDRFGLSSTQIIAPAGSAAAPSYTFAGDLDTGMFYRTTNAFGFAANGQQKLDVSASFVEVMNVPLLIGTRILNADGTASVPSFSFSSDTDTGFYRSASNTLVIVTGGTAALTIDDTALACGTRYFRAGDGDNLLPGISFANDTDTGIFRPGANQIKMTAGGVAKFGVDSAGGLVATAGYIQNSDGSAAAPAYSFFNLPGSGFYRVGSDVAVTLSGVQRAQWEGDQYQQADGTAALPAFSFFNDVNTGMYRIGGDSIGFATNGVLRVTINNSGLTVNSGTLSGTFTFADGSAAAPSIAFTSDTDTGFFTAGGNAIRAAANGTEILKIYYVSSTDNGLQMVATGATIQNNAGSATLPSYTFSGDADTGIYSQGANSIGFANGGTLRMYLAGGTLQSGTAGGMDLGSTSNYWGKVFLSDGSAAAPAFTFGLDDDSGLYRFGANELSFALGGVERFRLTVDNNANDIRMRVWDHTANALVQVSRGATDSGGTGFRVLRVPN